MSADVRFSSAIHFLILVKEAQTPMSSSQIAQSIGTNSSYIRKLASLLKNGGLIQSHKGKIGFSLTKEANQITLWDIAQAVMEIERFQLFEIHQNANDACIVGAHIQPTLNAIFSNLDQAAQELLQNQTLQDCIDQMRTQIALEPKAN